MKSSEDRTDGAPDAIILAAGKGVRMGTEAPKVLLDVVDRPMIAWVVQACVAAGVDRCIVVVGHGGELVRSALADQDCCFFVVQKELLGTAHAARMAESLFTDQPPRDVFVLAGDGPLIRPATLQKLLKVHRDGDAAATLATAVLDDPTGYGRIIRDDQGRFETIVEQKDASERQRLIREVNPSYYCFRSDRLFAALTRVQRANQQKEYYLTDVPALLQGEGHRVCVVDAVPPQDVLSINTAEQLKEVDAILTQRRAGVCR